MATKRKRSSGHWEFVVKRKALMPRPLVLTFKTESEGDDYCRRLEALLDRGIVPAEFADDRTVARTISDAIDAYLAAVAVPDSDRRLLASVSKTKGSDLLAAFDYRAVESWLEDMKRIDRKAPSTIRHYIGALGRCLDWFVVKYPARLPTNPIRKLPRRYARYSTADAAMAGVARGDTERDRRLAPDEEKAIRAVLAGRRPEFALLFSLALETGMRLREIYTLEGVQISITARTIFLDKTKNGDKRQVPLSTVAVGLLSPFANSEGRIFPWWDGKPESLNRTTSRISTLFGRIFEAAGCPDLRFHDLRHEATSRLYERTNLSDLQIAKITGHKGLRMLARYANLRASNLAEALW